jgi:hypothetical protein
MARTIEEFRFGFTAWARDLSLVCSVKINSGAYTASYLLVISPNVKRPRHKTEHVPPSTGARRMCGAASTHSKAFTA